MKLRLPYPEGASWKRNDDTVTIAFEVPEDFPYLEGHFPGNPLVPAVTQIGWATTAVEAFCGQRIEKYRLSRFKFMRAVRPLDRISISLMCQNNKYTFRLIVEEELCSAGNLILEDDV